MKIKLLVSSILLLTGSIGAMEQQKVGQLEFSNHSENLISVWFKGSKDFYGLLGYELRTVNPYDETQIPRLGQTYLYTTKGAFLIESGLRIFRLSLMISKKEGDKWEYDNVELQRLENPESKLPLVIIHKDGTPSITLR